MTLRHSLTMLLALVAAGLLLVGCGGGGGGGGGTDTGTTDPTPVYSSRSLTVSVGQRSSATQFRPFVFEGTFSDVTSVVVTVSGQNKYGVNQNPLDTISLSLVSGAWTGTFSDLAIGPTLTFTAKGYNSANTEIFSGTTNAVLSVSSSGVTVAMSPVDNGNAVQFPIIESIALGAEIAVDSTVDVTVAVTGASGESLSYLFTSGGGSFVPSNGSVGPLTSSGAADIVTAYTAPSSPNTYWHSVRVTNSQTNSVETDFPTVVVYNVVDADVSVLFAPVVTGILGKRTYASDVVTWTASVADDKPTSALTYSWTFTPGNTYSAIASFTTSDAIAGVMEGYDQDVTGTISLTVTDGDSLATTVTFTLVTGQFPDTVVVH